MKQIIQSYRTGTLKLSNVPLPALEPNQILVQTAFSAVSLGTEGKKVTTARKNLVGKARSRPDLVQQVIRTAQREGIASTYRKVANRLDQPISLGYSAAGTIIAVGTRVEAFQVGQQVACGGASASHAEVMAVPVNLCVKVPDGAKLEQAAFATIGAIALQGVRQADVTLGECVAVIGLGLVGQLTVQLLKANGCRVLGIDLDASKVAKAQELGADLGLTRHDPNLEASVSLFSRGYGVDAVLITAGTSSNDPAELAVELCRDRGRIVVVGGVKLDLPRDACYEKELEVKLSRSYGPGRYDPIYEEKGIDYPIGYVRWTEKRNMEAFLDLVAAGSLALDDLITHRFRFEQAEEAYNLLTGKQTDGPAPLGIVFEYDTSQDQLAASRRKIYTSSASKVQHLASGASNIGIGFIGAGSFARKFLIPPLSKDKQIELVGLSTATGISAENTAQKFGFAYSTDDVRQLLEDADIHALFIATRHQSHARLVIEALKAGKSVFVEKPLALKQYELAQIIESYQQSASDHSQAPILTVGFNRRFAPLTQEMMAFIRGRTEPLVVHYRVNAGFLEDTHWLHDPDVGGGRILGEVCHFVDLITYLVAAPLMTVYATRMDNVNRYHNDNLNITLTFADGSLGNILYVANGDSALAKERIELFCQGTTAVLDNFRRLELYHSSRQRNKKSTQDKGHSAEVQAFVNAVRHGGTLPIPFDELVLSTLATFKIVESLQLGQPVPVLLNDELITADEGETSS